MTINEFDQITGKIIQRYGGLGLLMGKYNGSVGKLLTTVFPEYKQHCRERLMHLARDLKLTTVEDLAGSSVVYLVSLSR